MRVAGALALAGFAGFLLGACGGGGGAGSALSTRTGVSVTRTAPTVARPTAPATTHSTPTVATTTVQLTTTAPHPTTTRPALTVTLAPTTSTVRATTTAAATTTAPAPVAAPPTTTALAEPVSSTGETPWGWIALVLALTGLAILGVVLWGRSRSRSASWSTHLADLRRRTLITLDEVLASGSVVTGKVEALASEARDLERHAGDDQTAAIAPLRGALDELSEALEADRTLRLATPPPTPEQLSYSDALIRQQVERLQGVLRSA